MKNLEKSRKISKNKIYNITSFSFDESHEVARDFLRLLAAPNSTPWLLGPLTGAAHFRLSPASLRWPEAGMSKKPRKFPDFEENLQKRQKM